MTFLLFLSNNESHIIYHKIRDYTSCLTFLSFISWSSLSILFPSTLVCSWITWFWAAHSITWRAHQVSRIHCHFLVESWRLPHFLSRSWCWCLLRTNHLSWSPLRKLLLDRYQSSLRYRYRWHHRYFGRTRKLLSIDENIGEILTSCCIVHFVREICFNHWLSVTNLSSFQGLLHLLSNIIKI